MFADLARATDRRDVTTQWSRRLDASSSVDFPRDRALEAFEPPRGDEMSARPGRKHRATSAASDDARATMAAVPQSLLVAATE